MKKIPSIIVFALAVLAGCSKVSFFDNSMPGYMSLSMKAEGDYVDVALKSTASNLDDFTVTISKSDGKYKSSWKYSEFPEAVSLAPGQYTVSASSPAPDEIRSFSRAAYTRAVLRKSNVGLMANMNEAMWSTYIDNYDLFTKIGPEIHYLPSSDYKEILDSLTDEEVKEYADSLTARYRMMDDVEQDKFLGCVRASLALKEMAQERDIDLMVYNDIDPSTFKVSGCRAGFYHDWFNESLSVLVPEADTGAGLATYVLKLISGGHVNFIEPFHIEDDFGTFAGGHAGPNDHTDPKWQDNVLIARDVRFAKTNYKYAGAPFGWYRFSPGMKTVTGIFEEDGRYKMVCFMAESLPGEHILATYSHSIFRPQVPVKELFARLLKVGVTQHYAITDGDYRKELGEFAEIMGFEFYDIR